MTPEQIEELKRFSELRNEGILTEAEFDAKKTQLLASSGRARPAQVDSVIRARGMQFGEAIRVCFAKYADFSGRATRSEYWYFALFTFVLNLATSGVDTAMNSGGTVNGIFTLATLVPSLVVFARRMHDTGRTGWWYALIFTCVGAIPVVIWLCQQTDGDTNRYGENPFTVPPLRIE